MKITSSFKPTRCLRFPGRTLCGQAFAHISLGTEPESSARNDYGVFIGYAIDWTPEITVTLSYRYALQDYTGRTALG